MLQANIFLLENSFSMIQANIFLIESSLSNVTTIHRDYPENRAKDASNSIVLKANIFLFENSFSMLQANIFLIESSLSNVTTIHRENPKIRAHDASTTMLRPPLLVITSKSNFPLLDFSWGSPGIIVFPSLLFASHSMIINFPIDFADMILLSNSKKN